MLVLFCSNKSQYACPARKLEYIKVWSPISIKALLRNLVQAQAQLPASSSNCFVACSRPIATEYRRVKHYPPPPHTHSMVVTGPITHYLYHKLRGVLEHPEPLAGYATAIYAIIIISMQIRDTFFPNY